VESFESTLDSVYRADLVLLVVDASEPVETMREKLVTSHDTLYERNEAPVVTVFNKVDRLAPGELADKRAALSGVAPDPVAVSAKRAPASRSSATASRRSYRTGSASGSSSPPDDAMSLVSWIHDHGHVEAETYADDQVTLDFEAKPSIVARARSKAAGLAPRGRRRLLPRTPEFRTKYTFLRLRGSIMDYAGVDGRRTNGLEDGDDAVEPPAGFSDRAVASDAGLYEAFAEEGPEAWRRAADLLDWERPSRPSSTTADPPFYEWFPDGRLNAAANCVDRHLDERRNQLAIRWFGKRGAPVAGRTPISTSTAK